MRWVRRVLAGTGVVVLVALVAVGVGGTVAVRRGFPVTSGELRLAGLTAPVTVERDATGIPTITASTVEDLFRAQGYVHAQDRFWEMDLRRHVTAGRLSELFGASQVETDAFIRTLGWRRVAEEELTLLEPETRRMLDAYAAGVNAWMGGRRGAALSLEHALLPLSGPRGYAPEPWSAADSVAWLKAMAWDLRSNLDDELMRARLAGVDLGPGRTIADLYPAFDATAFPPILPDGGSVVDGAFVAGTPSGGGASGASTPADDDAVVRTVDAVPFGDPAVRLALAAASAALDAAPMLLGDGAESGIGSNSWAVSGRRTATGGALLANDPHLAPGQPGIWYQVRLRCEPVGPDCPYDVAGFSFSGVPGIVIGRNDRVAWGFTNLGPDVADLVIERIEDDRYLTVDGWRPLEVRTETIRVARGEPVEITVRSTANGPLFSDVSDGAAEVAGGTLGDADPAAPNGTSHAIALRWTALDPSGTANAIPKLMTARDFDAFRAAARDFVVPSQNLLYADVDGHIGYQAPGAIPVRRSGDGTVPLPGWTGEAGWERLLDFEELPWVFDPPGGLIVTANQAVLPPGDEPFLHRDVASGHRGRRIVDLLGERAGLTLDDLAAIQLDNHNANAARLVPVLRALGSPDPAVRTVQATLAGWDHQDDVDSAASAAFNATWREVLALTFHDELPEWAWPTGGGRWWTVVDGLLEDPDAVWWDDRSTPEVERRDDVLAAAMRAAHDRLVDELGDDPADWRWGALHTLTLRHGTFGSSGIAPIEALFNRGPLETSGGGDIVNSTSWNAAAGFEVTWVPSMRMLVDLEDPDGGRWIHLTGQSGRPFHPHYWDQAERWRTGGYTPLVMGTGAARAAAVRTLTLVP